MDLRLERAVRHPARPAARFLLFAGTANPPLAAGVAKELAVNLGACAIERFPDGEVAVELKQSVRGHGAHDTFVVAASHGVLVHGARERLHQAGVTDILVADSVPVEIGGEPSVATAGVAPLLADVVRRLVTATSLRDLYATERGAAGLVQVRRLMC